MHGYTKKIVLWYFWPTKSYLERAQKNGEKNPEVAQKTSCLFVGSKDEYDLMNAKQRDEGKSCFGHPKRENQRGEQDEQEFGNVDEQYLNVKIKTIQKTKSKASGFFSDCQMAVTRLSPIHTLINLTEKIARKSAREPST